MHKKVEVISDNKNGRVRHEYRECNPAGHLPDTMVTQKSRPKLFGFHEMRLEMADFLSRDNPAEWCSQATRVVRLRIWGFLDAL
jgi:hypothetical protein